MHSPGGLDFAVVVELELVPVIVDGLLVGGCSVTIVVARTAVVSGLETIS